MEYIYAAMLLHSAGHKIEESTLTKVLDAAGAKHDTTKIKAVVAALDGINIEEAIAKAAVAPVAAAPASGAPAAKAEDEEANKAKADEEAAAGLGALFG